MTACPVEIGFIRTFQNDLPNPILLTKSNTIGPINSIVRHTLSWWKSWWKSRVEILVEISSSLILSNDGGLQETKKKGQLGDEHCVSASIRVGYKLQ